MDWFIEILLEVFGGIVGLTAIMLILPISVRAVRRKRRLKLVSKKNYK